MSNMFISDLLELDAGGLDERYGKGLSVYDISRRAYNETTDDGNQVAVVEITFDHREKPQSRKTVLSFSRDTNYSCVGYERWTLDKEGNWKQGESFKLSDFVELVAGVWVPTTLEVLEGGSVVMKLTTESLTVPTEIDDSLFAFDFPTGTEVHDDVIRTDLGEP